MAKKKNIVAKTINFSYEGKEYTLEYNRRVVKNIMERRGFNLNEVDSKPMTMLPLLFWGAFQMHHKGMTQDTTDQMLENFKDKEKLYEKLSEMYVDPINVLFDEPEDDEGNVSWDPSW